MNVGDTVRKMCLRKTFVLIFKTPVDIRGPRFGPSFLVFWSTILQFIIMRSVYKKFKNMKISIT